MTLASPIIAKELRTLLRAPRSLVMLLFTLAVIGFFFWLGWRDTGLEYRELRTGASRNIFFAIMIGQGLTLTLMATMVTAVSITTERDRKTLDLLLCTGLSARHIITAKWFSSICFILILAVSTLPLLMFCFILGGLSLVDFFGAYAVVFTSVATASMAGLAYSSTLRRPLPALIGAVALAIFMNFIPLIVVMIMIWEDAPTLARPVHASGLTVYFALFGVFYYVVARAFALRGLIVVDPPPTTVEITARRNDGEMLRRRRLAFPFYCLRPARLAGPAPDDPNLIAFHETRLAAYSMQTSLFHIFHFFCLLIVLLILFDQLTSGGTFSSGNVKPLVYIYVSFAFSLMVLPALAAIALTREREQDTWRLLRAAPLTPFQIVWGKFKFALRPPAVLMLAFLILPALVIFGRDWLSGLDLYRLLVSAMLNVLILALFAAVGIFWSALCRTSLQALLLTYGSVILGQLIAYWMADEDAYFLILSPGMYLDWYSRFQNQDANHIFLGGTTSEFLTVLPFFLKHAAFLVFSVFLILKAAAWRLRLASE